MYKSVKMHLRGLGITASNMLMLTPLRLSGTRMDQTETFEVRIVKFSPYGSLIPLASVRVSFLQKFYGFPQSGGVKQKRIGNTKPFPSFKQQYLENDRRYGLRQKLKN